MKRNIHLNVIKNTIITVSPIGLCVLIGPFFLFVFWSTLLCLCACVHVFVFFLCHMVMCCAFSGVHCVTGSPQVGDIHACSDREIHQPVLESHSPR